MDNQRGAAIEKEKACGPKQKRGERSRASDTHTEIESEREKNRFEVAGCKDVAVSRSRIHRRSSNAGICDWRGIL